MDLLQELALIKMAGDRVTSIRNGQSRQLEETTATKKELALLRAQLVQQGEESRLSLEQQAKLQELQALGRENLCRCEEAIDLLESPPNLLTLGLLEHETETARKTYRFTALEDIRYIKLISDKLKLKIVGAQIQDQLGDTPLGWFKKDIPNLADLFKKANELRKSRLFVPLDKVEEVSNLTSLKERSSEHIDRLLELFGHFGEIVYILRNSGFNKEARGQEIDSLENQIISAKTYLGNYDNSKQKLDVASNFREGLKLYESYGESLKSVKATYRNVTKREIAAILNLPFDVYQRIEARRGSVFSNDEIIPLLRKEIGLWYSYVDNLMAAQQQCSPRIGEPYFSSERKSLIDCFDKNSIDIDEVFAAANLLSELFETLDAELDCLSNRISELFLGEEKSSFNLRFQILVDALGRDGVDIGEILNPHLGQFIFRNGEYYESITSELRDQLGYLESIKEQYNTDCLIIERVVRHAESLNHYSAEKELEEVSGRFKAIDVNQYRAYINQISSPLIQASVLLERLKQLAKNRKSALRSFFVSAKEVSAIVDECDKIKTYYNSLPESELRASFTPVVQAMESELQVLA